MKRLLAALALAGTLTALAWAVPDGGNLEVLGRRAFHDPLKLFMGRPDRDAGLYGFVQERPEGLWAGLETFARPETGPVSDGYGALPGRLWFRDTLIEADGTLVVRAVVTERIYLQEPARTPGGAITYDAQDLGSYLARDGAAVILYVGGREVQRWTR